MKTELDVTNSVTVWWRPHKVGIQTGILQGSFEGSFYPLADAVGGAFDMLADSSVTKTVEEFAKFVQTFTKMWGFLVSDRRDGKTRGCRFAELYYRRNRLVALAYLASAFRNNKDLDSAITHFWKSDKALRAFQEEKEAKLEARMVEWGWPPKEPPLYHYEFSDEMQIRMEEEGISRKQLEHEEWYHWPKPPSRGYVAHVLAQELQVPSELRAVESNGKWEVVESPIQSLEHAILWTIRQRLEVIDYRICKSCGHGFVAKRNDQRFCTDGCGARLRMQKHRAKKSKSNRK